MIQVAHDESRRRKEGVWKDCSVERRQSTRIGERQCPGWWDSGQGRASCERMESLVSHPKPVQAPFSRRLELPGEGNIAKRVATTPLRPPCRCTLLPALSGLCTHVTLCLGRLEEPGDPASFPAGWSRTLAEGHAPVRRATSRGWRLLTTLPLFPGNAAAKAEVPQRKEEETAGPCGVPAFTGCCSCFGLRAGASVPHQRLL